LTVALDQLGERRANLIDDRWRRFDQSRAHRGADAAQHHRKIECEERFVTPIVARRVDIDPRERRFVREPAREPAQCRLRVCNVHRLATVPSRQPGEPLQEITRYFGIDVIGTAIFADPSGHRPRMTAIDLLRRAH
jgi:hypothetical protein